MRRSKQFVQIGALVLLLIVASCGIPKVAQKEADTSVPETFTIGSSDTANTANINWKDFFEDPYLVALIDSALENNKELNIIKQTIDIANNEVQVRKGEYLPFVSAVVGADVEKVGEYTRNGAVEEGLEIKPGQDFPSSLGNFQVGLVASWELDVWKKLRNAKKAAVFEYLATIEGKNYNVTLLVAEIANSYYELLALDNQLANLEQNIQIQQNALDIVEMLKNAGRENQLAVNRFEAEVKKNQSEVFKLKQQIIEKENIISFLIGAPYQPIERSTSALLDLKPKVIASGIPSQLLENRPDVRQAEMELLAAELNIQVAKANFYPSFGIKAGVGFEAFNPKFLFNTPQSLLYNLGMDMLAPLINRNAIKAEYKTATSRQIQAAFEYEQTILNAFMEVEVQLSNMDNLQQNYDLKSEQVDILTNSIDISNQLFQSARADYMEVLLTQRDALEARMELIETKKEQLSAMVNLYKALGGGWN
jgi:NodT family efflux transporter outer membrane factor (OMF) lipoprotein